MLIFNKESKKKPPNFEPWTNQDDKNLEELERSNVLLQENQLYCLEAQC